MAARLVCGQNLKHADQDSKRQMCLVQCLLKINVKTAVYTHYVNDDGSKTSKSKFRPVWD